jgi:hypothetical protein
MTAAEVSLFCVSLACYATFMVLLLTLRRYQGENLVRMSALCSAVFLCLLVAILRSMPQTAVGGLLAIAGIAIGFAVRDMVQAGKDGPHD